MDIFGPGHDYYHSNCLDIWSGKVFNMFCGQWSMVMVMVFVILPIGFRYNQENHENG